ncbi:MAG: D-glycerate dehydrogenase [Rhodobacteraceae bacterium]|nr:D-glycerate dehydrogenase [Paracoccaceae bacterium]
MTQKVLITRPLPESVQTRAAGLFEVEQRESTGPMSRAEMLRSLAEFDAVLPTLGDLYSAEIFAEAGAPRAKLLANFGVGYNHIDVEAARAAGIAVSNTPGAVTDATADIAMMLVLMVARRAGEGERLVRRRDWQGWHPVQMLGLHVTGKRLGVIGMGRIGKAIARRAQRGFDMEIVFYNRSPVADAGVPATQLGSLAEVLASADVTVLAVPGGAATHHLIGAEALASVKPGAFLVNISRGDVIDEDALIDALQAGRLGGAGLDVYEREPEVPDALVAMENVVLLPHLGTAALEVRENMGHMAVDNLEAFFAGSPPPNLL